MDNLSSYRTFFVVWVLGFAFVMAFIATAQEGGDGGNTFIPTFFLAAIAQVPLFVVVLMVEQVARNQATALARIEAALAANPADASSD
ncbi:hypothetical protein [Demequina phytophila]|uniref:hypothetical protein n=1 Tax=Demequina phytophila TaxID=1638981 RepID=UPI0007829B34|nr:hypothetical protein [Demequina phytophila]